MLVRQRHPLHLSGELFKRLANVEMSTSSAAARWHNDLFRPRRRLL